MWNRRVRQFLMAVGGGIAGVILALSLAITLLNPGPQAGS